MWNLSSRSSWTWLTKLKIINFSWANGALFILFVNGVHFDNLLYSWRVLGLVSMKLFDSPPTNWIKATFFRNQFMGNSCLTFFTQKQKGRENHQVQRVLEAGTFFKHTTRAQSVKLRHRFKAPFRKPKLNSVLARLSKTKRTWNSALTAENTLEVRCTLCDICDTYTLADLSQHQTRTAMHTVALARGNKYVDCESCGKIHIVGPCSPSSAQ